MTNLLPHDGTVFYMPSVFNEVESSLIFTTLLSEADWQHDVVKIFGKVHITSRKVAWYGDEDFSYSYSNSTKVALPWTKTLFEVKQRVEQHCATKFNSCLLNLYHNGNEGMGWHSDDERVLGINPQIASVSFGAPRKFLFKHKKSDEGISMILENGSVLLMKDETQHFWKHTLPKSRRVHHPRINLTFRKFIG